MAGKITMTLMYKLADRGGKESRRNKAIGF